MKEYSQTGGLRDGMFNVTWPLASITASHDELKIRCLRMQVYVFRRETIHLSRHRGLFSVGLSIGRRTSDQSRAVIFWTFDFDGLRKELEALGYVVADAVEKTT